ERVDRDQHHVDAHRRAAVAARWRYRRRRCNDEDNTDTQGAACRPEGPETAEDQCWLPFGSLTAFAICSSVANHTPGFDFMYVISLSSCIRRERCPDTCGCVVRTTIVRS